MTVTAKPNALRNDFHKEELPYALNTVSGAPSTVTLGPEYLKTLSDGKHTVLIQGENGFVEASFTVKKAAKETETADTGSGAGQGTAAKTGDGTEAAPWIAAMLLSLGIMLAAGIRRQRRDA